jgi:hypothetical protein
MVQMSLSRLLEKLPITDTRGTADPLISRIVYDSGTPTKRPSL